ncbi:aldehyde dehydrogenase family protein (plasmid) [Burkholderia vietnamiensis]|uniref:Aldehyde dehydrogenase n=1 Tax=Burkholderia vietnamiensis (strain G4 / LMG 22486) TaxID=269482 RepID=A4JTS0_BURVG|nr:aldehyde dehydrogenase [Burkholderia vietnamiensis G4]MCB4350169.1 aldehyde dehydrogenase family protein [Burkholderia vietnamiensis]
MSDFVCVSPVDGRELARRPYMSDQAVKGVLQQARAAQREWAQVPIAERAAYVMRFVEAMRAMDSDIVPELALQMGRPVRYGGEFRSFEERVRYMVNIAESSLAPTTAFDEQAGIQRFIKREPLGIVLTIAPWNYPYLTAANSIIPALMAGNAVILKHAAQTLLVGERFAAAFAKAGLPSGLFANVAISHEQVSRLTGAGEVNHVSFTGSVAGGRAVERAAAGSFTTIGLELGGKDPGYVRPDADVRKAVETLVDGAFFNSGQCCCAIERIYVHEKLFDEFVEQAVSIASGYVLGNPLEAGTTLGPMAAVRFADGVRSQIQEAVAAGAKPLLDSRSFSADREGTAYLAPQIFVNVNHSMRMMVEETFGPIVGIMKVKSDEEAVQLMNDSPYGLTASIWTNDADAARRLGDRIETGTVFMNRCDYVDPGLAWTGVKDTGRGVSLSRLGYDALTRPKSFHLRQLT